MSPEMKKNVQNTAISLAVVYVAPPAYRALKRAVRRSPKTTHPIVFDITTLPSDAHRIDTY